MKSMTYGTFPCIMDFFQAFNRECPSGTYKIRNSRLVGACDFTARELWAFLKAIKLLDDYNVKEDNEWMDLACDIFSTLGFEWI